MPKARDYLLTEQELTAVEAAIRHDKRSEARQRCTVIWLPPCCSELNPIELFWRYLKGQTCTNKLQDNLEEVVKIAVKRMTTQNSQTSDPKFYVSKHL
jgi:transposase